MVSVTKRVLTDESIDILHSVGLYHYVPRFAAGMELDFLSDFCDAIAKMQDEQNAAGNEDEINRLSERIETLEDQNDSMQRAFIEIDTKVADIEHDYRFERVSISDVVDILNDVADTTSAIIREIDNE